MTCKDCNRTIPTTDYSSIHGRRCWPCGRVYIHTSREKAIANHLRASGNYFECVRDLNTHRLV